MPGINHFLNIDDIDAKTLKEILAHAHELKKLKFNPPQLFKGLSLAMVFDKKSTRTRFSFEVAFKQLGGHTIVTSMDEIQLTGAESIEDTGQVLSRFVDAIMIRMSDHATLKKLSENTTIPVINGLTNHSHPCQIMASILTMEEKLGPIAGKKIAWLGDYNNVAHAFVQASEKFDFELTLAVPESLRHKADKRANLVDTAEEAVKDVDVVVTDTWVSMGQEGKAIEIFESYQVNSKLMTLAKESAIFTHCMPIHRGEEVTEEVLASPASVIYDEAENRVHEQKAILAWCLADTEVNV